MERCSLRWTEIGGGRNLACGGRNLVCGGRKLAGEIFWLGFHSLDSGQLFSSISLYYNQLSTTSYGEVISAVDANWLVKFFLAGISFSRLRSAFLSISLYYNQLSTTSYGEVISAVDANWLVKFFLAGISFSRLRSAFLSISLYYNQLSTTSYGEVISAVDGNWLVRWTEFYSFYLFYLIWPAFLDRDSALFFEPYTV